jgi:lysozyme family protein
VQSVLCAVGAFFHLDRADYESGQAIVTVSGVELSHRKNSGSHLNESDIRSITANPNATIFDFNPIPVYKQMYWDNRFSNLSKSVALVIADIAFHQGSGTATRFVREVLQDIEPKYEAGARLTKESLSGQEIEYVKNVLPDAMIIGLKEKAEDRLNHLSGSRANKQYRRGWQARVDTYEKMAAPNSIALWEDAKKNAAIARGLISPTEQESLIAMEASDKVPAGVLSESESSSEHQDDILMGFAP